MAQEINLGGTIYISSKRAAEITGYTQDYIGQLARAGSITAQRVSGLWYVVEDSLRQYKSKADQFKPTPPPLHSRLEHQFESSISFDGRDYVSAQRAAEITGYHPDYVGQLARTGKVVSRQVGSRWFVDREAVVEHKRHNDALLAAVQAESVGLLKQEPIQPEVAQSLHFSYIESSEPVKLPEIMKGSDAEYQAGSVESEEPITEIPIRVIKSNKNQYLGNTPVRTGQSYLTSVFTVLAVVALVVVPVFGGVYYTYSNKHTAGIIVSERGDQITQLASALVPSQKLISSVKLPAVLEEVVAKTLYYRRDSF